MSRTQHLLVFFLDRQGYALPLSAVERVLRAVEVTPAPNAPDVILGMINMQGQILPVVDLRQCFRLPRRPICLSDRLIIARVPPHTVGLVVDAIDRVVECPEGQIIATERIASDLGPTSGVVKLEDRIVFIQNLDMLLVAEAQALADLAANNGKGAYGG